MQQFLRTLYPLRDHGVEEADDLHFGRRIQASLDQFGKGDVEDISQTIIVLLLLVDELLEGWEVVEAVHEEDEEPIGFLEADALFDRSAHLLVDAVF